jgi:transcriptional regulator with XRE-family HTH domain
MTPTRPPADRRLVRRPPVNSADPVRLIPAGRDGGGRPAPGGLAARAGAGDTTLPRHRTQAMADSINEFGAMLRSWRDRASPEEFGLPVAAHRRARGLRRQELARLAGVSPDYLIQLEQGRASVPSPEVLTALGRALRLTEAEREHLLQLAGQLVPAEKRIRTTLPHSVRRLVEQLSASPAAVCDAGWNPIAWNVMWSAAIGDPLERPDRERNVASPTCDRASADIRATSASRSLSPTCPRPARGFAVSGRRVASVSTNKNARPSTIPRPACCRWTATSSPHTAMTFAWSYIPRPRQPVRQGARRAHRDLRRQAAADRSSTRRPGGMRPTSTGSNRKR